MSDFDDNDNEIDEALLKKLRIQDADKESDMDDALSDDDDDWHLSDIEESVTYDLDDIEGDVGDPFGEDAIADILSKEDKNLIMGEDAEPAEEAVVSQAEGTPSINVSKQDVDPAQAGQMAGNITQTASMSVEDMAKRLAPEEAAQKPSEPAPKDQPQNQPQNQSFQQTPQTPEQQFSPAGFGNFGMVNLSHSATSPEERPEMEEINEPVIKDQTPKIDPAQPQDQMAAMEPPAPKPDTQPDTQSETQDQQEAKFSYRVEPAQKDQTDEADNDIGIEELKAPVDEAEQAYRSEDDIMYYESVSLDDDLDEEEAALQASYEDQDLKDREEAEAAEYEDSPIAFDEDEEDHKKARRERLHQQSDRDIVRLPSSFRKWTVRFILLVFPLIAIGIAFYIFILPQMMKEAAPNLTFEDVNVDEVGTIEMVKPSYRAFDDEQNPYNVIAQKAKRDVNNPDRLELEQPEARMDINTQDTIEVKANRGVYEKEAGKLSLDGKVRIYEKAGYELQTEEINFDLEAGTAKADGPIKGIAPRGDISSQGLLIENNGERVLLKGKSKVILR